MFAAQIKQVAIRANLRVDRSHRKRRRREFKMIDDARYHWMRIFDEAHATDLGLHVRKPRHRDSEESSSDAVTIFEKPDSLLASHLGLQSPRAITAGNATAYHSHV
jgi:hypothetical protein